MYCDCHDILLAIILLRSDLVYSCFLVRTDHAVLKWVMGLTTSTGRLARWLRCIFEFAFDDMNRPGVVYHEQYALLWLRTHGADISELDDYIQPRTVLSDPTVLFTVHGGADIDTKRHGLSVGPARRNTIPQNDALNRSALRTLHVYGRASYAGTGSDNDETSTNARITALRAEDMAVLQVLKCPDADVPISKHTFLVAEKLDAYCMALAKTVGVASSDFF